MRAPHARWRLFLGQGTAAEPGQPARR
jgi:hypothetical protein